MKRLCILLLCWLLLPFPVAAGQEALPLLGVAVYNGEDTFMSSLMAVIQSQADGQVRLLMYDSANDQNLQNDQVADMIAQGCEALIINPVDRTAAIYLIQMAMRHDLPIVLINREPLGSDLALYDRAYYVGIDPKQQGLLQGQMAAAYFLSHPEADINGDGKMQLVLLRGQPGHQDTELRSVYAIRALQDAGVQTELLSEESAMWERTAAQERMSAMLSQFAGRIECVIANNDDMALGAIDALKAAGYFDGHRFIPVLGVDATAPAMEALSQGALYATVYNNALEQGQAALRLALLLAQSEAVTPQNFPYVMNDKVVYIDSDARMAEDAP